jgi:hypothetical protein
MFITEQNIGIQESEMEHDAFSYNQEREILIGSYPTDSNEWQIITRIVNRGIDSRLKAIQWRMEDATDKYDKILRQERVSFYVLDTDSLAILLYRLDEMQAQGELDAMDSEQELNILTDVFLGIEEPLILDIPWIRNCPNCEETMQEPEDGVYTCSLCDWSRDFKSSWPYIHWYKDNVYHYQMRWARIDLAVSMLFKRNDDE